MRAVMHGSLVLTQGLSCKVARLQGDGCGCAMAAVVRSRWLRLCEAMAAAVRGNVCGFHRPNAGLVMQGCKLARRWLRLCDRDGCWCAMTAGDGCCWARRSLWQCPAMAAAVSGVGCWLLTVSCRLLAVGCWLVLCQAMAAAVPGGGCGSARWWLRLCQFISSWLSAVGCWLLAVGCRLLAGAVPGGGRGSARWLLAVGR